MKKLIILEHSENAVHIYDVTSEVTIDDSFVQDLGYKLSNVSWMCGKDTHIHFFGKPL